MNETVSLGVPYMHPVCPLSLNHVKLFVIADTFARFQRMEGNKVYFPLGFHYSGIEPITLSEKISGALKGEENGFLEKLEKTHDIDSGDFSRLTAPLDLLDYFSERQIRDLKKLEITADFDNIYHTKEMRYEKYLDALYIQYDDCNVIINTSEGSALKYSDKIWKQDVKNQLSVTKIITPNLKKILEDRLDTFFGEYYFVRSRGIGKKYGGGIIEPMSDSELFNLFEAQEGLTKLPITRFFVEEHLKTWVIKRIFAETLILPDQLRTKEYSVLGMGKYDGKIISASKGIGEMLPSLLNKYGKNLTRVSLLLTSHPSKNFNWTGESALSSKKILKKYERFKSCMLGLSAGKNPELDNLIDESKMIIRGNMKSGDFRFACLEALVEMPKKVKMMMLNSKGNADKYFHYIDELFGLGE
ncbi:MAG: hypothetical protein Q8O89_00990 [Nanoarchaeota archaeon]|nr:hypothetical protein [Nanoarchaeota archaeon]